jgi:hypothetical protein
MLDGKRNSDSVAQRTDEARRLISENTNVLNPKIIERILL